MINRGTPGSRSPGLRTYGERVADIDLRFDAATGDLALTCRQCSEQMAVQRAEGTAVMSATTILFKENHEACLPERPDGSLPKRRA